MMMEFASFLDYLKKNKTIPNSPVLSFVGTGNDYPLLFFSQVISFLQKNNRPVEAISLEAAADIDIKSYLATVGLQGPVTYWFNDFYTVSAKKQREWINYFQGYTGPHAIIFFCNEESCRPLLQKMEQSVLVTMPTEFSMHDISLVRFLVNDNPHAVNSSIDAGLFMQVIPLNTLCLLSYYELVVGKNWNNFLKEWGPHIIEPASSLFLLSQYFFGKKSQLFFSRWSYSYDVYQSAFWPSFWADQLWRAYMYCDLMQQKKYAEAKKVQYKLPYSFINRDWSSFSLLELSKAHQYVSELDYRLKNGGSPAVLELFFSKFFNNIFKDKNKNIVSNNR